MIIGAAAFVISVMCLCTAWICMSIDGVSEAIREKDKL